MQKSEATAEGNQGAGSAQKQVESVMQTLQAIDNRKISMPENTSAEETLAGVAHDARNMMTALGLYCDLLEEPGVLATPFAHYATDLRRVASASRRLVETLMALEAPPAPNGHEPTRQEPNRQEQNRQEPNSQAPNRADRLPGALRPALPADAGQQRREARPEELAGRFASGRGLRPEPIPASMQERNRRWDLLPAVPVANLAAELMANRNLLGALAGTSVALTLDTDGGACPVRLTAEDLTRVLVNLVKNSTEAMPEGGRINIALAERAAAKGAAPYALLSLEDNGPGIPADRLEEIFISGYSTKSEKDQGTGGWPVSHRGLGLAITRALVEAAGGRIAASNGATGGARFVIELPVEERRVSSL